MFLYCIFSLFVLAFFEQVHHKVIKIVYPNYLHVLCATMLAMLSMYYNMAYCHPSPLSFFTVCRIVHMISVIETFNNAKIGIV